MSKVEKFSKQKLCVLIKLVGCEPKIVFILLPKEQKFPILVSRIMQSVPIYEYFPK